MAYSQILDLTNEINNSASNTVFIDTGSFTSIIGQVVSNTSSVSVSTSNDGGGVDGVIDNNSISAINFRNCNGIDLSSNDPTTNLTDTISNQKLVKFNNYGKYLQFSATGAVDKLLLNCIQIY